jgi:hypothetical protein
MWIQFMDLLPDQLPFSPVLYSISLSFFCVSFVAVDKDEFVVPAKEAKSVLAVVFTVKADKSAESTGSMHEGQVNERRSQSGWKIIF